MQPARFMLHGVVREKGRGIPMYLYQKKKKKKLAVVKAKWTIKVSTLNGDAVIPGIVALLLYTSKPFYFMSNTCEKIKWKQTTRQVRHIDLQIPVFGIN